jgi:copper chaperone CopZ
MKAKQLGILSALTAIQAKIPVKGMSCFTCEIAAQSVIKKLPSLSRVKASAKEGTVWVSYDSAKISVDEIVAAINQAGYKAEKPDG